MDELNTTVYFAGFAHGSTEDHFKEVFSKFGEIKKIFVHNNKNYGMVEFMENRSCQEAIKALNLVPPDKLQVNMARERKDFIRNRNENLHPSNAFVENKHFNKHRSSMDAVNVNDELLYDIEEYYVDENNEFVTVFTDPASNEIYVPLRYASGLRKITRKVPVCISTADNERLSISSDHSDRKVKLNRKFDNQNVHNITIETKNSPNTSLEENNSSFSTHGLKHSKNNVSNDHVVNHNGFQKQSDENLFNKKRSQKHTETNKAQGSLSSDSDSNRASNNYKKQHNFKPKKSFTEETINNKSDKGTKILNERKVSESSTSAENIRESEKHNKNRKKITYKSIELPMNQYTEVFVETAENDTVGWASIVDKKAEMDQLVLETSTLVQSLPSCIPEVGQLVLALYSEAWFRAIVLEVLPVIRVRYIDYGNVSVVCKEEIKDIPPKLASIPAYTLRIKLANGAPCKLKDELIINVKPVSNDGDTVVVHVENGIYEKDEIINLPVKQDHILNKLHRQLLSQVKLQDSGFIELNIKLSDTKYIASFMPLNLTDDILKLQSLEPKTNPQYKPKIGDIVCAKNEEGWQRAFLINIMSNSYNVGFIDFGTIMDVSEVHYLPDNFTNVPIFSCICSCTNSNAAILAKIKEPVDFEIIDISGNDMKCTLKIDNDSLCDVICTPWDPRIDVPNVNKKATEDITSENSVSVASKNLKLPKLPVIALKNGDDIKLEMESNGYLFVRNKFAVETRKKIDKYMFENGAKAPLISQKPKEGQLVAAQFENEWYRAIIKSVNNNDATIFYIDYGNEEIKPFFSLKELDDKMCNEPATIIKIKLKYFLNKPFSVEVLEYLEKLAMSKIILKASYEQSPENGFILKTQDGRNINEELHKIDKKVNKSSSSSDSYRKPKSPITNQIPVENEMYKSIKVPGDNEKRISMSEIPLQEIPLGKTEILFQEFSNIADGLLCVCVNNPTILHKTHVELQSQITKYVTHIAPKKPYKPVAEECVLVQESGKWYRGACTTNTIDDKFDVFLIDYGSVKEFSSSNIRRMPVEFAKEKALTNFATFENFPTNPSQKFLDRIETLFERNNTYNVDVLQKIEEDEYYIISFPTIFQVLKKENLL